MKRLCLLVLVMSVALLATACAETATDEDASPTTGDAAQVATATAADGAPTTTPEPAATTPPTATPEPTSTSEPPTPTPEPTATPEPTVTPVPPTPTPEPTSTPVPPTPTPEPTLTVEEIKAQYRTDLDVREVDKNIQAHYDWKLMYEGQVLTIEQDAERTLLQVRVAYPGGSDYDRVTIMVLYQDPHAGDGIYEDDYVAIWGRPITMFEFTNVLGGKVAQPLFSGDYIEKR